MEILEDATISLEQAATLFEVARCAPARPQDEVSRLEAAFGDSLELKKKLDGLESGGSEALSFATLAVILNCEYQLYRLNRSTPLRYNPFLSHWVEAITTWEPRLQEHQPHDASANGVPLQPEWAQLHRTRLSLVKAILADADLPRIARFSPIELYEQFVKNPVTDFHLDPYITMLEEEGIYEECEATAAREASPPQSPPEPPAPQTHSTGSDSSSPTAPPSQRPIVKPEDFLELYSTHPEDAVYALTHLSFEIRDLEIINGLLEAGELPKRSLDAPNIVREYLQHKLRIIEKMGERRPWVEDADLDDNYVPYDPPGVVRAIQLLVLFIRNIVRKKWFLAPESELYFEIQEICYKYLYIPAARELRACVAEEQAW